VGSGVGEFLLVGRWESTAVYLIPLRQPEIAFRPLLSADELARADRFVFAKDRQAFTVAHGVMRQILADTLRLSPHELAFQTNEYGKPHLVGQVLPFNLSHSGDYGLLAVGEVGETRPCGIDIEQLSRTINIHDIAPHYFSPAEQTELYALPPAQQTSGFFKLWTRKEAYIKAWGMGLSLPLADFDITISEPPRLLRHVGQPSAPEQWQIHHLELPIPDYMAALVVAQR
jgi:4'-phosphopantetheinyl transferase